MQACLNDRVQDHRPLAVTECQPVCGQCVCQSIFATVAGKGDAHIHAHFHGGVYHIRRGHDHDDIGLCFIVECDMSLLCKHRDHAAHIQGIAVALQGAVVAFHHYRFFDLFACQVIDHVRTAVDAFVGQPGGKLFHYSFGIFCCFFLRRHINSGLYLRRGGFRLYLRHRVGTGRHQRCTCIGQPLGHTKGQCIAVLGDGHRLVFAKLLGKGYLPASGGVDVSSVRFCCQGVVDGFPCAVLFIVNRLRVCHRQMQTVGKKKLFCVLCAFLSDLVKNARGCIRFCRA